ncbi:hypothetical protein [Kitasatospora griseola]|uniref:hypothetical protein n=1 Tax=Kitasatospora griseola TaxID=2064 RepID=UPI0037F94E76
MATGPTAPSTRRTARSSTGSTPATPSPAASFRRPPSSPGPAALVHVASTKRALLDLVLAELTAPAPDGTDLPGRLRALRDRPRWQNAAEIVLMCEATVPSHPAHPHMAARLDHSLALTAHHLEETTELTGEAAATTAQWLVALALGALIASLYDPDDVDLEALLGGPLPLRTP